MKILRKLRIYLAHADLVITLNRLILEQQTEINRLRALLEPPDPQATNNLRFDTNDPAATNDLPSHLVTGAIKRCSKKNRGVFLTRGGP